MPADTSNNVANENEIAGWQTYKNDKYEFEFKYPPNYKISSLRGGEVSMSLESDYAFMDFFDSQSPGVGKSITVNVIEGIESGEVSGNMDGGIDFGVSFRNPYTRNGYLEVLFATKRKGYESKVEEFREIISTFKFTK